MAAEMRRTGSFVQKLLLWAYAPWAWLVFAPAVGLLTLFWGSLAWLIGYVNADLGFGCAKPWGRMLCLVNFTRVRLRLVEHLRRGRAYVVMSNHQSHFDVLAVCARTPVPVRCVIKEELRKVPVLGPTCAKLGCVFIDRRDRARAIASLRSDATRALLERGISLLVFPEGTRRRDGRLGEFKKGGFMVALELELPILPISVSGSRHVLPPGTKKLMPGCITVTVHEPIESKHYGLARRDALMRDVRDAIASGLEADERGELPPPVASPAGGDPHLHPEPGVSLGNALGVGD